MKQYNKIINFRCTAIFVMLIILVQIFLNGVFKTAPQASELKSNLDQTYISEKNYDEDMRNIVEPYINSKMKNGYIDGDENVKLYYEKYIIENAKGNIVISHGYTETLERYHEMIYYFMKNGYNVFGIEHRGHGRSGSLGIVDKTQIDVRNFNQYVTDLKKFMDEVVFQNNQGEKVLLFAHSMGGAIGVKFLEDYPQYFDAALLNAPMLEVHTGNMPKFLANIIVGFSVLIGNDEEYVIGKGPYTSEFDIEKISTSSINRYKYDNDNVANNEILQRGGASYNWTNEAFKITEEIVKKENASKVKIPVLLFQSGQDTYVKEGGQNEFANYAKNCEIKRIENSRHLIYMENDEIQKPYLYEVFDFYNKAVS